MFNVANHNINQLLKTTSRQQRHKSEVYFRIITGQVEWIAGIDFLHKEADL
jgi:hypothetical protein